MSEKREKDERKKGEGGENEMRNKVKSPSNYSELANQICVECARSEEPNW